MSKSNGKGKGIVSPQGRHVASRPGVAEAIELYSLEGDYEAQIEILRVVLESSLKGNLVMVMNPILIDRMIQNAQVVT